MNHVLAYALVGLVCCMTLVPRWCVVIISRIFVFIYPLVARKEHRRLQLNAHRILGLAPHSSFSRSFERQCLTHAIESNIECLREIYFPGYVHIENYENYRDHLAEIRKLNAGIVIISGHLGGWELVAKYTAQAYEGNLFVLAKRAPFAFVTIALDLLRQRAGSQVLWNNSPHLFRDMLAVLKKGDILGFVMDQKPGKRIGYMTNFLGYPAEFVTGPAAMALRGETPVLAAYCMRLKPGHYRLQYETLRLPHEQFTESELTEKMVRSIENMVKAYPEQWTWNYKRWKFENMQLASEGP